MSTPTSAAVDSFYTMAVRRNFHPKRTAYSPKRFRRQMSNAAPLNRS